jgi:predicted nucleotidyltransferase
MQTALELGRKGWERYLKSGRHKTPKTQLSPSEQKERNHLLRQIQKAADEIKLRFNVRRIVLFGSLAHEGWFVSDSDVDLAVEGMQGDDYWNAWRIAEDAVKDRSVDFIEIETTGTALRQAIDRYRLEL